MSDQLREALADCVKWMEGFARTESDPGTDLLGTLYRAQGALADSATAGGPFFADPKKDRRCTVEFHADAPLAWHVTDEMIRAALATELEDGPISQDVGFEMMRLILENATLYAHPEDAAPVAWRWRHKDWLEGQWNAGTALPCHISERNKGNYEIRPLVDAHPEDAKETVDL